MLACPGVVTGMHGGIEHVLVDFADADLDRLCIDDKIQIRSGDRD